MSLDFWSARSSRYHTRRFAFVRKLKSSTTPLRFAGHRRQTNLDEEEQESFDSVEHYRKLAEEKLMASFRVRWLAEEAARQQQKQKQLQQQQQASEMNMHSLPETPEENKFEKSMEPVFACYYKPVMSKEVFPPSPPETPLGAEQIIDRAISAAVARRCAEENPWAMIPSSS